jgi:hypothetical protein
MTTRGGSAQQLATASLLDALLQAWSMKPTARLRELESQCSALLNCASPAFEIASVQSIYDPAVKWQTEKTCPPVSELACFEKADIPAAELQIFAILQQHFLGGLSWFHNKSEEWCAPNNGRSDTSCVIIGAFREALLRHISVMVGLMYLGPGIVYPEHAHSGFELYHVLAGSCEMSKDGSAFEKRVPGDVVIHEPHEVHASRTAAEGVLILWGKWNDFEQSYYFVDKKQSSRL